MTIFDNYKSSAQKTEATLRRTDKDEAIRAHLQGYTKMVTFCIIGAVLSFLLLIAYMICCSDCCPPKACRSNTPMGGGCKCVLVTIFLIIASVMIISAVFAQFLSEALRTNLNQAQCSLVSLFDTLINGEYNPEKSYLGLDGISIRLSALQVKMIEIPDRLNVALSNSAWVERGADPLKDAITNVYQRNKGQTLFNPNPYSTSATINSAIIQVSLNFSYVLLKRHN
jgi:hypothetical protein